ncbi:MAG: MoaD/ThiS family protein [Microcoleus sp.]
MAQTIFLEGTLADQFGATHQIELPEARLQDAIQIVDVNHPGFFALLAGADSQGGGFDVYSHLNNCYLLPDDYRYPLDDGDTITIRPSVAGSGGKNGFLIQALGIAAIGGVIALTGGAATPLFIAAGLTLAKGVLSLALTPTTSKKKERRKSTFFQASIALARDRRLPKIYGAPTNSSGKIVGWRCPGLYCSNIVVNRSIGDDE